jgi:hypothetical protein
MRRTYFLGLVASLTLPFVTACQGAASMRPVEMGPVDGGGDCHMEQGRLKAAESA